MAIIQGKAYLVDEIDDGTAVLPPGQSIDESTCQGPRFLLDESRVGTNESEYEEHVDLCFQFAFYLGEPGNSWDKYLWLFCKDCGDLEQVSQLVQKFLRQFRSGQSWSATYAVTCSKPRVGEFGGGAVVVTAERVTWHDARSFAESEQQEYAKRQSECDNPILDGSGCRPQEFTAAELATILAALRHWQDTVTNGNPSIADQYPHFDDRVQPLSIECIDQLCQSLNLM